MKNLTLYQVDAFAEQPFSGNPAAVVILEEWLPTDLMQNIALENNLSETAFLVKKDAFYEVRYFTPNVEVELCGHATLGSAFVLFNLIKVEESTLIFRTMKRGDLFISRKDDLILLDFPKDDSSEIEIPEFTIDALGAAPAQVLKGRTDLMLVYENEAQIKALDPNFDLMKKVKARGIMVTAPGNEVDFVSRFFAPQSGINEDPVTGSAHTTLIPYWSKRLGKSTLLAKQLSKRGGTIYCEMKGDRVSIGGKAIHYLTGTISV